MSTNPLLKVLLRRGSLSNDEQAALLRAIAGTRHVAADQVIVHEGSYLNQSTFLLSGFAGRFKDVMSGKRQILAVHVKGDFIDLHSFLLKKMDHGVYAMSPCTLAWVPHEALRDITERFPNLTRQLWLSTLIDAAIHREWLTGMGRRPALSNVAHFLCEIFVRLSTVDEADGFNFRLPITQEEFADARGISVVHLNRSIQELRARKLITWSGENISIDNWDQLVHLAQFDPDYLRIEQAPFKPG